MRFQVLLDIPEDQIHAQHFCAKLADVQNLWLSLMSVIVIEVVPEGIVFGADRNRTQTNTQTGQQAQIQVTKVGKSANNRILVGSIGCGLIAGVSALDWLLDFVNARENLALEDLAREVKEAVQTARNATDGANPRPQIINLAGFVEDNGVMVPSVRYISNCWSLVNGNYTDVRSDFGEYPDVFRLNLPVAPALVRPVIEALANDFNPFWFHHSIGLTDFNILKAFLQQALQIISKQNNRVVPNALADWEKQVRMSVLVYGAFFEAFSGTGQQYVGGGADVISLPWP